MVEAAAAIPVPSGDEDAAMQEATGLTQEFKDLGRPPPGLEPKTPMKAALPHGGLPDRLLGRGWAEWTEEAILANVEFLQARAATRPFGSDPKHINDPAELYRDWRSLAAGLQAHGY